VRAQLLEMHVLSALRAIGTISWMSVGLGLVYFTIMSSPSLDLIHEKSRPIGRHHVRHRYPGLGKELILF
jgi:hypothetical protein